jgi:DNA-binding NtrC family response regulator
VREKLDQLVAEMIEKRIYLQEAAGEFEKKFIQSALKKTEGNQSRAAEILGLHRNTLSRKISLHKLNGQH